jgi:hypothetical protein
MIPESEQRVLVARDPVDDGRRQLADKRGPGRLLATTVGPSATATVRHLDDIVVGQLFRQSWNGARREPRQATNAMWPPHTQSARVAAALDREAERTARRVSSASGTHNSSISAPRMKKLSLTPQWSAMPPISGGITIEVSRCPV